MKRSEMLEHLEAELVEYEIHIQNRKTEKSKIHCRKNTADGILAMLEGFGMLPPQPPLTNYRLWDKE